jgi:hypothetical protein
LLALPATHGFKLRALTGSQRRQLLLLLDAQARYLGLMLRRKPVKMDLLLPDEILQLLLQSRPEGI